MGPIADIDEVMFSCGVDILHPGGMEKTEEMAVLCGIDRGKRVIDVGSGKGITASHLARKFGCDCIGVDLSERMVRHASNRARRMGLSAHVQFRKADARHLPFADGSFDILLAECSTSLVDKTRAFNEYLRVVKNGGFIGVLDMLWQKEPPTVLSDKVHRLWDGFQTMTLKGWSDFFTAQGLTDVKICDYSKMMRTMKKDTVRQIGVTGALKMGIVLLFRENIRQALGEYRELFDAFADYFGYGVIVGQKI